MRSRSIAAAFVAALAFPAAADAGRLTLGVELGRSQSDVDVDVDASGTAGLWARLRFGRRFNTGLELRRISTENDTSRVRIVTSWSQVDLAYLRGGALVPVAGVGLGLGKQTTAYSEDPLAQIEAGVGLEYRPAGFVIGAGFRIGNREVAHTVYDAQEGVLARIPTSLASGEYRAVGLYLGMRL